MGQLKETVNQLEKKLDKLRKAHNTLQGFVEEAAEQIDDHEEELTKGSELSKRNSKNIKRLKETIETIQNKLEVMQADTGDIKELSTKFIKEGVAVALHNAEIDMAEMIIKDVAADTLARYAANKVRVETKTYRNGNFKLGLFETLGKQGFRLAHVLGPPVMNDDVYVFQREVYTPPKKKKISRTPA